MGKCISILLKRSSVRILFTCSCLVAGMSAGCLKLPSEPDLSVQTYTPVIIGSYDTPGNANGVFVQGSYAYVTDGVGGMHIVDVSDPTNPTLAATYSDVVSSNVIVAGNYAYVEDWDDLEIVDVSNPRNPTFVGRYSTTTEIIEDIFVSGNYAYLAKGDSGLKVIDISNKASPSMIGEYLYTEIWNNDTLIRPAQSVVVSGNYAYVGVPVAGLLSINVSNPANPFLTDEHNGADPDNLFRNGEMLYSLGGRFLTFMRLTDPSNPSYIDAFEIPHHSWGFHVSGSYAFLAGSDSSLQIIEVSDPHAPILRGIYQTPDVAWDVFVSDNYVYVADGSAGLLIWKL